MGNRDVRRVSFSGTGTYSFLLGVTGIVLLGFAVVCVAIGLGDALGPFLFLLGLGLAGVVQWIVRRQMTLRTVDFGAREVRLPGMRLPFGFLRAVRLDSGLADAPGTEFAHGRPGTSGFRQRYQEWELVLERNDEGEPVTLVRSLRLAALVRKGRSLAERLEIPFEHEGRTRATAELAGDGAATVISTAPAGRLEVLPDPPAVPRVRVEGGALVVESSGKGWFRFGYALFIGALGVVGIFGMYEVEKRPVSEPFGASQWACAIFAGLLVLGALVQLALILLGENTKRTRVDRRGVHASTARRGSRATTIPLASVAVVQAEHQSAGPDDFVHQAVIVGEDGTSIRILCGSERDVEWMVEQLRAAIAATARD